MTEDVHASSQLALVKLNEIDSADEKHNHGSTALWLGKKWKQQERNGKAYRDWNEQKLKYTLYLTR